MIIFFVLLWFIMAFVVAGMASSRGHSWFAWFFYGFLIWPLAFIHILLTPATDKAQRKGGITAGRLPCPFCAELVLPEAKVCPHCRSAMPDGFGAKPPPTPLIGSGRAGQIASYAVGAAVLFLVTIVVVAVLKR